MPSEPLRRCLRLLDRHLAGDVPPWRPKPLYGDPPAAPLTLAELHRGWRAILAEVLGPAPAELAPLAEAIQADAAEALAATARVIALLQEAPHA